MTAHRGLRRRRTIHRGIVGGLVLFPAVAALAACGGPGRPIGSRTGRPSGDSAWLASTGYELRGGDALLQLTAAEISDLRVDSVVQLLRRSPRLEVRQRQDGFKEYLLHRAAGWAGRSREDTGCALDFYLNGNRLEMRVGDIRELQPDRVLELYELTALEIFQAADAPVGSAEGCGAVLYWVARRRERFDDPFTGTIAGRVLRRPEGDGIAGVPVTLEPGGLRRVSDARGAFDFGALPPTRYRVEANVPEWGVYRTELPLRRGSAAEVLIEIERRGPGAARDSVAL